MESLESMKVCPGVSSKHYQSVLPENISMPVFKTNGGEPDAFVDYHSVDKQHVMRSTKCQY